MLGTEHALPQVERFTADRLRLLEAMCKLQGDGQVL
jgi:hypothetical protein